MKLGLGTVQFGLSYGINNKEGKPGRDQIEKILQLAKKSGIDLLDTAADYGDSEDTIGSLIQDSQFSIITKTSKSTSVTESVHNSLTKLNSKHLTGLLVHDFQQYHSNPAMWREMKRMKIENLVDKIGFSLYSPDQLELLLNNKVDFEILQVPYSIFDQRFESYFKKLKHLGIEIHVRSSFVQGLVFRSPESLSSYFDPIKEKLKLLSKRSQETGKSIQSLCLNFAIVNAEIDRVIIGVDSEENLRSNIDAIRVGLTESEVGNLRELREDNEEMILPFKWKV